MNKSEIKSAMESIKKELDKARAALNKKLNSMDMSKISSFEEWEEKLEPFYAKTSELSHHLQVLEPVEWEEWEEDGDMFTLEDWKDCVESGGFIDYDGFGHYSDGKRESNKTVSPSHVAKGWLLENPEFTHIIWYNR